MFECVGTKGVMPTKIIIPLFQKMMGFNLIKLAFRQEITCGFTKLSNRYNELVTWATLPVS